MARGSFFPVAILSCGLVVVSCSTSTANQQVVLHPHPAVTRLASVACFGSRCLTFGSGYGRSFAFVSQNGGERWAQLPLPEASQVTDLSCPQQDACWVTGSTNSPSRPNVLLLSHDFGSTFTSEAVPSDVQVFSSVACSSRSTCVAAGLTAPTSPSAPSARGVTWRTSDSGDHWSEDYLPGSFISLDSLDCVNAMACVIGGSIPVAGSVDSVPTLLFTTDGGVTWTPSQVPSALSYENGAVHQVECLSASDCLALALTAASADRFPPPGIYTSEPEFLASSDGGQNWSRSPSSLAGEQPSAFTCVAAQRCVAAVASGFVESTDGGVSWKAWGSAGQQLGGVFDIACPNASDCVATGDKSGKSATGLPLLSPRIATTATGASGWHVTLSD